MKINEIIQDLERKHPNEPEYIQAVTEVLHSVEEVYYQHPEFEKAKIIERMVEPDRIITFRVTWVDDKGEVQTQQVVNRWSLNAELHYHEKNSVLSPNGFLTSICREF